MTPVNLVNGEPGAGVDAADRGLAYGDGVFRTLMVRSGKPLFWNRQYAKLAADCASLRIACPEARIIEGDIALGASPRGECVARITITRGCGPRGYAVPHRAESNRIVSLGPRPEFPASHASQGVVVRLCTMRLARQVVLAGVKHLNRLENVLARSEWDDPGIAEGLMCDTGGEVVSGTMSNLFVVSDGRLLTPDLRFCGVAGVTRDRVIACARREGIPIEIAHLGIEQVCAAEEVFLVNSVIGLWPVAAFLHKKWRRGPITGRIQELLCEEEQT